MPLVGSNASPAALQSVRLHLADVVRATTRPAGPGPLRARPAAGRTAGSRSSRRRTSAGQDVVAASGRSSAGRPALIAEPVIWTERRPPTPARRRTRADITRCWPSKPDGGLLLLRRAGRRRVHQAAPGGRLPRGVYAPGFLTEGAVLDELEGRTRRASMTALNYSADLNNTANRVFASAYRKKYTASPPPRTRWRRTTPRRCSTRRSSWPARSPRRSRSTWRSARSARSTARAAIWQFNQPRTPQQKWYLREVQRDGQVLSNVLINELATLG